MTIRIQILIVALACILFTACNQQEAKKAEKLKAEAKNLENKKNEAVVKQAIKEAQSSLPDFFKTFEAQEDANYNYSIKMAFNDFQKTEHVWLDNLKYENGTLYGFVANTPKHMPHIKKDDMIKIESDKVVDWMYLRNKVLKGGYTIKAIRENMTAAEKKAFDEKMGFIIR